MPLDTASKLLFLQDTKSFIKDAIIAKGVDVPDDTLFRDYATKISEITTGGGGGEIADAWIRPIEWLPLPDNINGVQKVSILNAVFNTDSEFVAFNFSGSYTVDWGDGQVESFSTWTKAEHKYDYNNVNLSDSTVAKFGYKQCIITITPQAGENFSTINFQQYHSSIGASTVYDLATGFLDIRINSNFCSSLLISTEGNAVTKHTLLEQCLIGEAILANLNGMFYDCYSLQSVNIKNTSNIQSFDNIHYNNFLLRKMPAYTFRSSGVNTRGMYYNCRSLVETEALHITPLLSDSFSNMFYGCTIVKSIDLTIESNINYALSGIVQQCQSLDEISIVQLGTGKINGLDNSFYGTLIKTSPALDTSSCGTFSNTFYNCYKLTSLYQYDYSAAYTLSSMLYGCRILKNAGYFNTTSLLYSVASMCSNCFSMESAPVFADSSGVTAAGSMLYSCNSLAVIPDYVFGNIVTSGINSFAGNCDSLQIMPNIAIGSTYTSNTSILTNSFSLKRMLLPLKYSFSISNAKMSANALNEMYSILPSVGATQTITVTGNHGATNNPILSLSCGTNMHSRVVSIANTVGLSVGMFVTGTGITTSGSGAAALVITSTNVLDRESNHGLVVGDIVSFNIVSLSGLPLNVIMYVVEVPTENTFKVSLTQGGEAQILSGNGSIVYYNTPSFIESIVTNTSVTLSVPATMTGTFTLSFRNNAHKTYLATMKKWAVTG